MYWMCDCLYGQCHVKNPTMSLPSILDPDCSTGRKWKKPHNYPKTRFWHCYIGRPSQGTVNGGAVSKWPRCWRDVKTQTNKQEQTLVATLMPTKCACVMNSIQPTTTLSTLKKSAKIRRSWQLCQGSGLASSPRSSSKIGPNQTGLSTLINHLAAVVLTLTSYFAKS